MIQSSRKPLLLIGSQTMLLPSKGEELVKNIENLGLPVFVSGTARGFLSKTKLPVYRHMRKSALKDTDLVILAGVPCDFRLDYGRHINHRAKTVAINLSRKDLYLNRRPNVAIVSDPCLFLIELGQNITVGNWQGWHNILSKRDLERTAEITQQGNEKTDFINPIKLCSLIDQQLRDGDIIIADGGDFVATSSYVLRPRSLMGWLDPGVFGTLGVGAGFILGAHFTNPDSLIWAVFGDGAFGFSMMEFDTFTRYKIPVVAVIGNDSSWSQIARDQVAFLNDPIGTELSETKYHKAVDGLGGDGYFIDSEDQIQDVLSRAKESALGGRPVVVNARIGKTEFRKGSISI